LCDRGQGGQDADGKGSQFAGQTRGKNEFSQQDIIVFAKLRQGLEFMINAAVLCRFSQSGGKMPKNAIILVFVCFTSLCVFAATAQSREQYLRQMDQGLDMVASKLQGKPRHPLHFSANLFFAHGAFIQYMPQDALLKYADALRDAGANRVDINLAIDAWRNNKPDVIKKYDAVSERIRQDGMQLVINPEFNRTTDKTYTFAAWSADALKLYPEIAKRYRPDIFVVIHEPTTMAARMGQSVSPGQWADFAQQAIRAVKQASPKTRCGVGLLPRESTYTQPFLELDGLDTLSVDIYALEGLKTLNEMIGAARSHGKGIYVEETWRKPYVPTRQPNLEAWTAMGIGNAAYQALDAKWMETIANYASVWGMEAVTSFWTQTFFLYVNDKGDGALDPAYNKRVIDAINQGARTKTFETYKQLALKFRNAP
jgi:hypothetical protein